MRQAVRIGLIMAMVLMVTGLPALALGSGYGVGVPAEPTFTVYALRFVGIALALFLLFLGSRFPSMTAGVFLLTVLTFISLRFLGPFTYLGACVAAVVVFGMLYAIYRTAPRLFLFFACAWVLPAGYLLVVLDSGSFSVDQRILLALAGMGALLGALFPRFSISLLSVGVGTFLLMVFLPVRIGMVLAAGLAGAALLVQWIDFFGVRQVHRTYTEARSVRMENWQSDARMGTVTAGLFLLVLFLLAAFTAPVVSSDHPVHAKRLERLQSAGLDWPGFLVSPADSFYLTGHGWPVALLGTGKPSLDRLKVLVMGRDPRNLVHEARTVKDDTELEIMSRAAQITSRAMAAVADAVKPGITEKELAGIIEHVFKEAGADGYAFKSIVGSGPNACKPHYQANRSRLEQGFVVVDIGCQLDGYASDMTRTFPVDRKYSETELELANLVLKSKETAVAMLKPGVRYRDVNKASRAVFEQAGLAQFYTHAVGHHVGLDVHDPYADILEKGMVVTIEPGLYIPRGAPVDPRYWDLGIRIEDTYVITETGARAITVYDQIPYLVTESEPEVEAVAPEEKLEGIADPGTGETETEETQVDPD